MILLSLFATLFFIIVNQPIWAFGFAFAATILFIRSIYADKAVYLLRIEAEKETARQEEAIKLKAQYNLFDKALKERLAQGDSLYAINGQLVLGRFMLNGQFERRAIVKHGRIIPVATEVPVKEWA